MNYIILDTETTGLDLPIKAVEVAWLHVDEDMNVLDSQEHRINPYRPINAGASEIHGIYDQDVTDCPSIEEVLVRLPQPFVFIGHNMAFDARVIGEHVTYNDDLCTLALSRRWVKGTTNHKLVTLKAELGLSEQKSHSALGDCQTCLELLRHIAGLTGRTLPELVTLERTPKMLQKMPFGMHKGKTFDKIPADYRKWMMAQTDWHKDVLYTLEKTKAL